MDNLIVWGAARKQKVYEPVTKYKYKSAWFPHSSKHHKKLIDQFFKFKNSHQWSKGVDGRHWHSDLWLFQLIGVE